MLLGVVGLAVLTPLVYSGSAALLKHTFTDLGVTLILGLWLLKVITSGTKINVRQQLFLPLMAFFLVSVVSLVNATNLEAGRALQDRVGSARLPEAWDRKTGDNETCPGETSRM